jgi:Sec-independent protein secretion pathway component TatC
MVLPFLEKGIVIQYTDPWESLQGYLYIVIIIGFILSLLVSQNHLLAFLNPGLIQKERIKLKQSLTLMSIFIVVSILYIWWFLGPLSIDWVLRFIVDGSIYVPKYLALTDRIFQLMVGIGLLS